MRARVWIMHNGTSRSPGDSTAPLFHQWISLFIIIIFNIYLFGCTGPPTLGAQSPCHRTSREVPNQFGFALDRHQPAFTERLGSGSWGFLLVFYTVSPAFDSEESNSSRSLQCKWQQILEYPELSESHFRLHPTSLSVCIVFIFARMGPLYFWEFPQPLIILGWTWMIYPARVIKIDCGLWRRDSLSNLHPQNNWIYFAWTVINAR